MVVWACNEELFLILCVCLQFVSILISFTTDDNVKQIDKAGGMEEHCPLYFPLPRIEYLFYEC